MRTISNENQLVGIVIRDRDGVLFDGKAESLSSYNETGEFDVLSLHTNFISIISRNITVRLEGGAVKSLPIQTGVMKVNKNNIEVYLGISH